MLRYFSVRSIIFILFAIVFILFFIVWTTIHSRAYSNNLIIKLKIQGTNQTSNKKSAKIIIYNQTQKIQENSNVGLIKQSDNSYQANLPLDLISFTDKYAIFIKPNRTIGKLICNNNLTLCQSPELFFQKGTNQLDLTRTLFYVGDTDQNGVINGADVSLLLKYLGKDNNEAIETADLNSDSVVDSQDYALLIYGLYQNQVEPQINFLQQSTPTITIAPTPTDTTIITPTPSGKCHAVKPELAGGGAYDLDNGANSVCTCTMGVCAQAKCNDCRSGICNCGEVPLQMPPIEMNCTGGAIFTIQLCDP